MTLVFNHVLLLFAFIYISWCSTRFSCELDDSLTVRLYLQMFVGGLISYQRCLGLYAFSGVQHILCFVFVLFVFVMYLVCLMLPVSLDCTFNKIDC
jgi:hypothetical protein